jgi:ABC-type multidrug transport system fused ATPase/permease subunit
MTKKELKRENIHDLFIMVLQDTWLFNGSIRDNIKYNKKNCCSIKFALNIVGQLLIYNCSINNLIVSDLIAYFIP